MLFQYPATQRRTAKFLAREAQAIEAATEQVLDEFGATATLAKAGVEKSSSGKLYARVTLRNGQGPTPVAPILARLRELGITATPTQTERDGMIQIERFTMFNPEESWINTTATQEVAS